MILNELKAAAEAAKYYGFGCGDPECRCFACLVQPPTILKLIAVVEAARSWVGTAGPLYEAFQELEK